MSPLTGMMRCGQTGGPERHDRSVFGKDGPAFPIWDAS